MRLSAPTFRWRPARLGRRSIAALSRSRFASSATAPPTSARFTRPSISPPIGSVPAVEHPAADRARAYGLEPIKIDGNDADAVYRVAKESIAKARAQGGPSLIEAKTYRTTGHSRADPAKYRPKGELEDWLGRDPIALYRNRLVELGFDEISLGDIESTVQRAVDQATEAAKASPPSPAEVIERDVWADGGSSWRN